MDFLAQINTAIGAHQHLRTEAERLVRPKSEGGEGLEWGDSRVQDVYAQSESALNDGRKWKADRDRATLAAELAATVEAGDASQGTPPNPVPGGDAFAQGYAGARTIDGGKGIGPLTIDPLPTLDAWNGQGRPVASERALRYLREGHWPGLQDDHIEPMRSREYAAAFTHLVQVGGQIASLPERDRKLLRRSFDAEVAEDKRIDAAFTLQTQVDELGGYTVPLDWQPELIRSVEAMSVMRQLGTVRPTSSNRVRQTRVKAASGANTDIFTSAFVGGWATEVPTSGDQEAEPTFEALYTDIQMTRILAWLSEQEVMDASFDVLALLRDDGAVNMALVEDKGILDGSGVNGEPKGLLKDPDIATVDVEGSTSNTISNTSSATGSAPKLLDLANALPPQYRNGATFLMHQDTELAIRKLVDANERFIWRAGFETNPDTLLGKPVRVSDFMPDNATPADGTKVIVYGQFRFLRIWDRQRLTARVLLETRGDIEQIGLRLNSRLGVAVTLPQAFKFGIV